MIGNTFEVKYFMGVVEDRDDPMKLGRVKVRVFSLHSYQKHKDDISGIPTEDLLWMHPIQPTTSAAISGIGTSPVGMVRGTHVFGLYLDKYYLNGIVLGTYGGNNTDLANTNYGFVDPLGIYPKNKGVDTDNLALGDQAGLSDQEVQIQNRNLDIGLNPSTDGAENAIPDDNPDINALKMLERDEGVRTKVYWDHLGYPTIGIGHLIIHEKTRDLNRINSILSKELGKEVYNEINMNDVSLLFNRDYQEVLNGIKNSSLLSPIYEDQNASRKLALVNMAFQLGIGGLSKFTKSLDLIKNKKYREASIELRNSLWYNQTLGRATRVIKVIETGNMESYGVMSKGAQPAMFSMATMSTADDGQEQPFTPEDTRIMFTEPASPYKGEYPYNKTTVTEGGHIFEIDDTPGHERIKNKHTSGTYEEIGPDGEKVTKIVADNYTLVHGNDHLLIEGDLKLVISKNSNVYIMGNVTQTIDGNVSQIVRGNSVSLIEGNNTSTINGDNTSLIEGNNTSTINGDSTETIQGNYTKQINGNYSMSVAGTITESAGSDWSRNSGGSTYDIASATYNIDAGRINIG